MGFPSVRFSHCGLLFIRVDAALVFFFYTREMGSICQEAQGAYYLQCVSSIYTYCNTVSIAVGIHCCSLVPFFLSFWDFSPFQSCEFLLESSVLYVLHNKSVSLL